MGIGVEIFSVIVHAKVYYTKGPLMLSGESKLLFACTLISCMPGEYKDVVEDVKKLEGVVDAFGVHGRWDVVVEIEVTDLKALGETALKINGLEGVRASETLVGLQED